MKREDTIGYCVRTLNNALKRHIDSSATKQTLDNVTGMHGWVIGYLYDHRDRDLFQRDFEADFNIRRSTATEIMKVMEKNGLILREPVESDKRLKKIVLTEKSIKYHEEFTRYVEEFEETMKQGISEEELAVFFKVIRKVKENAEENL